MLFEHFRNKNLSWRVFANIMALALLVSCFLAWRDEYHKTVTLSDATEKAKSEIGELRGDLKVSQARAADLQLLLDKNRITGPPAESIGRAALFIESLAKPDLSSCPLKVGIVVRNTGTAPSLRLSVRAAYAASNSTQNDMVDKARVAYFDNVMGNGIAYPILLVLTDCDPSQLRGFQTGATPLTFYFRISYTDHQGVRSEPPSYCYHWSATSGVFYVC